MNNVSNNFFKNVKRDNKLPLYPEEAYSLQNNQSFQQEHEKNDPAGIMQNPLLPLLLSSLQGGGSGDNMAMLTKMLSGMNGNQTNQLIETLTTSLNKNKKKEATKTSAVSSEKPFPKNEYLV